MLYVAVGDFTEDCVIDVARYFNIVKRPDWFDDEFVRRAIREIDKSEVIEGEFIKSPVFGAMAPERLSSGCKAVILLRKMPHYIVYGTRCGDNCYPIINELGKIQDIRILLHHCPKMPEDIRATFVESGEEVSNRHDFVEEYYRLRRSLT